MAASAGSALSLIKAVLELVADRRTGVLDVSADGVRTQIYFGDGKPLFAEDDAPGESFGRLLMRQGVITNDQFVRVIDEMTRAAAGNNPLRFGEVGVALGDLTPAQVERGLAEQVCGIIARALQRGESRWEFDGSPGAAKPPRAFFLAINPTVLEPLRSLTDRADIAKLADMIAAGPDAFVVVAGSLPALAVDTREGGGGPADDAHATRMAAEQAFQKGMALLREAKTASAAIELRRAAELQPESLEYELYAVWAKARSYREVPIESDRQALQDLAQRAKRRDPMLSFASYVIGQVAMWAGDDATAKKWFYEALRLDPNSEAAKQVRVLARRGAGSAAPPAAEAEPPVTEAPPNHEAPPEPAPVAQAEPPGQAAAGSSLPKASSGRRAGWVVPGMALIATAAIAIFVVARRSPPTVEIAPRIVPAIAPAASPAPSIDASPPVETGREEPSAPTAEQGTKVTKALNEKAEGADAEMGTALMPPRASGHRIFVDGRRSKTDGSEPLRLRCGSHSIQIGSSGTAETVEVPCGGEVQLQ